MEGFWLDLVHFWGEKWHQKKGQKVAIVTTEEFLVTQMKRMLGQYRFDVDILTMEKALCHYE